MAKSPVGKPPKSSWRARGLPPAIALEVARHDTRRSRSARIATVVLLAAMGVTAAAYFGSQHARDASLVTRAIAGGERSFATIAAVVSAPPKAIAPDRLTTAEPVTQTQVLSAAPVFETAPEAATARKISELPQAVVAVAPSIGVSPPADATPPADGAPAPSTTSGDMVVTAASDLPTVPTAAAPRPWAPVVAAASPPPTKLAAAAQTAVAAAVPVPRRTAVPSAVPGVPPTTAACVSTVVSAARQTVIWFEIGSADVSVIQAALIGRLADELGRCPSATLEIGGHTDTVGVDNNNFALSWRRAEAVRSLLEAGGVAPGRLVPVGYGTREPMPVVKTATSKDVNQLNRRVEFKAR